MIRFEQVSVTYPDANAPVLRDVTVEIPEGELCLVIGQTGSGKSTFLRAINGLVPHFTGGRLGGRVTVAGRDTQSHPPRELADVVGVVLQRPLAGFVAETVEDELAYGMECLGTPPATMRKRVEELLDLLGLVDVRDRLLVTLSAGQQQRVAIGAALAASPPVLVLDEPTSALDPPAAEEVLAALTRLVHDLGMTVVLAEHRLERVVQYADRVVVVPGNGEPVRSGKPADMLRDAPVAPPVVQLGRLAGWSPLPLSVRDARRLAGPMRERIGVLTPANGRARGDLLVDCTRLAATYGDVVALRDIDVQVRRGEVVALMGRNGSGKSTLLACLTGLHQPVSGRISVDGAPPALDRTRVALVPHDPADLLYAETVAEECAQSDRDARVPAGDTRQLLADLAPDIDLELNPRDLSEGQRLALALAVMLVGKPRLVLLDEPTRGLDYPSKDRLAAIVRGLASDGCGVVLATHDVELAADISTRTVVLADGEVVADGPTREVITSSPAFAPQVAKILAPVAALTVRDVERALA